MGVEVLGLGFRVRVKSSRLRESATCYKHVIQDLGPWL